MPSTLSGYLSRVYLTTLSLGVIGGTIVVYVNEVYHKVPYNKDWDNPFLNIILFLLIGVGESIIPMVAFYLLIKAVLLLPIKGKKALVYLIGLLCTIAPFFQIYYMVNEGYHRSNIVIYAICFILSLTLSYRVYNGNLTKLTNKE